ncbi:MAG: hypothetical protein QOF48_801 [Verrucomicrobiota bacterium]|jgi:putative membrane-bound dehydrogenase-like protein
MNRVSLSALPLLLALPAFAASYHPDHTRQLGFTIYTNHPPGKQITSNQLPATTPALAPDETQKQIHVPPGFEVRLFASEPEVVNPVAMTWDERGRLWVLELYEYPKGAAKGEKGRDRIKILEDTDADGRADKVTVFADGFSLATGLVLGNGGVYLGAAPNFYFLQDTNGDDKADVTTILKTGFGMEDRHELLNSFAWGPDGWLYMTHGVFTHSKVRDPSSTSTTRTNAAADEHDPDGFGVQVDAALARYHPRTRKFEVFADGTSNPWGVDWNETGDAFVSACVIQHLFHVAAGGQYNRQGGTWANPYGYVGDLPSKGLPAIVDWRHYRAAHSGICVYQGDQWPAAWRGLVFLGNIHQNAINCDRLTSVGSTYRADKESQLLGASKGDFEVGAGNFLVSKDPWFRPVTTQTGPDGAVWIADWCDKYPCYQNAQADPEGVDREMGRIWRVVWVGNQPGKPVPSRPDPAMDLQKESTGMLIKGLESKNSWQRRQAQRLLTERLTGPGRIPPDAIASLSRLAASAESGPTRLSAMGVLHAIGNLKSNPTLWSNQSQGAAAWTARFIGESAGDFKPAQQKIAFSMLDHLAAEPEAATRAAAAVALRQFSAPALTIDSTVPPAVPTSAVLAHFKPLMARPSVNGDFYYPHIVWMAMEPRVATDPQAFFPMLGANDNSISAYCLRRVMRRICDLTDTRAREQHLNAAMKFLGTLALKTGLANAALDGLIDAFKSKGQPPTIRLDPIFTQLSSNPQLAEKTRRLATLLGDTSASRSLLAKINDITAPLEDRLKGIQAARETKDDVARAELLKFTRQPMAGQPTKVSRPPDSGADAQLQQEALRALGSFGGDDIAYVITDAWQKFNLPTRRVAADVLVTRSKWSRALLAAVDRKVVEPQDISATARRALARSDDATVRDHADRVLGRYRPPGDDKLKTIAAKRVTVLAGEPDIKNGYEVAKRTCFVCHKLHGEGADVCPDLTGVGRSTLDALLHNVIDPNEVVGHGNEATEVELKDGSTVSGRIVEDTPSRLRLVAAGPVEHILARSDIAVENGKPRIRTSELSLMPEGLEVIPDKDFRDLIWFILNPPADKRPWTPALRKELIGN